MIEILVLLILIVLVIILNKLNYLVSDFQSLLDSIRKSTRCVEELNEKINSSTYSSNDAGLQNIVDSQDSNESETIHDGANSEVDDLINLEERKLPDTSDESQTYTGPKPPALPLDVVKEEAVIIKVEDEAKKQNETDVPQDSIQDEELNIEGSKQTEEVEDEPLVEQDLPLASIHKVDTDDVAEVPTITQDASFSDIKEPISRPNSPTIDVSEGVEKVFSSLKKIFVDNWLSAVGIIMLVIGMGFFVKYAIDQDWINEVARVGIGVLTGAAIIAIALKLKKNYNGFAAVLVGGGISVLYMTITLAFREYELFSQTIAFGILIAITLLSVLLSLFYDRKELAFFSILGGFAAPLMISTGSGNFVVLFSYLLLLNTGMLLVSLKKDWKLISSECYYLTLLFFWGWLLDTDVTDIRISSTLFAFLFFVQFYILAIIQIMRKEGSQFSAYQAFLVLSNNVSFLGASLLIWDGTPYSGLIVVLLALLNAALMFIVFKNKSVDRKFVFMLVAVVISLVSLAVPIQLDGYSITLFWIVEAVVLLVLWRNSRINTLQVGYLALFALAIVSYCMDLGDSYFAYGTELSIVLNPIFITGLVLTIGLLIAFYLLRKEDSQLGLYLKGNLLVRVGELVLLFKSLTVLAVFLVPFLEINFQLQNSENVYINGNFRLLSLLSYTVAFLAVIASVKRTRFTSLNRISIFYFIFYPVGILSYWFVTHNSLYQFYIHHVNTGLFSVRFVALLGLIVIGYLLIKNGRKTFGPIFNLFCIVIFITSLLLASSEADNVAIQFFTPTGDTNYYGLSVLFKNVRTIVYPIVWGVLALFAMIVGLKKNEVVLRKISLILFGIILVKFYTLDVWGMNQAGRIVSFVVLGAILLLVSFLQQKIKVLVKDDQTDKELVEKNENRNEEN